jgi:hypothetical protein
MEEMYAAFHAWRKTFEKNIVDMGGRLDDGGKILTSDSSTDGPFVEAKEMLGGFMILEADDMDEAVKVASACPGVLMPGGSVEIREIITA